MSLCGDISQNKDDLNDEDFNDDQQVQGNNEGDNKSLNDDLEDNFSAITVNLLETSQMYVNLTTSYILSSLSLILF